MSLSMNYKKYVILVYILVILVVVDSFSMVVKKDNTETTIY